MPCPEEFLRGYVAAALYDLNEELNEEHGLIPPMIEMVDSDIETESLAALHRNCDVFYDAAAELLTEQPLTRDGWTLDHQNGNDLYCCQRGDLYAFSRGEWKQGERLNIMGARQTFPGRLTVAADGRLRLATTK